MTLWLVTGGCGFIGSHLCAALVAAGQSVRVLDNLSTGRRENLAPGAELLVGDVGDPELLARAMEGVAGCFHLAAIASVERGVREWRETHRVNLSAFVALLDAARAAGGVPVVYASSAAVYGSNDALPLAETADTRPISAYGADKLGCELQARVAGAAERMIDDGLSVAGFSQSPCQPQHRGAAPGADIEYRRCRIRPAHAGTQRRHNLGDMHEIAALQPVAEHGQRLAAQQPVGED